MKFFLIITIAIYINTYMYIQLYNNMVHLLKFLKNIKLCEISDPARISIYRSYDRSWGDGYPINLNFDRHFFPLARLGLKSEKVLSRELLFFFLKSEVVHKKKVLRSIVFLFIRWIWALKSKAINFTEDYITIVIDIYI